MDIEKLVRKARKGDDKAFSKLMEIKKETIYRIGFAYVKNKEDALDVVQETVYKAYISIENLKDEKSFNSWIARITINNAINLIRKNSRVILLDEVKEQSERIEGDIVDKMDMLSAIDKLEDKHKQVIILKYFDDLTIRGISEALEIPEGTVKTYLNKGLSKLRNYMGKEIV